MIAGLVGLYYVMDYACGVWSNDAFGDRGWLAIALVIRFFVRRGKAKFRAVLSLVAGLVCVALGVVLYYQGMLREYFAVRNFWHIRTPGWIGLALVALLLLWFLVGHAL